MNPISKSMTDLSVSQMDAANLGKADGKLAKKVGGHSRDEVRGVAEDFESLFLGIVLKSMRQTVQKSGLLDGGNAEDIYASMLDDEYAKTMAAQRHTGIADNIEEFLLRSYGEKMLADPAVEKAIGMKTYQQQGLQIPEKQARIDSSGIPSVPVANVPGKELFLQPSIPQKPL